MKNPDIDPKLLREHFNYDAVTGILTWRKPNARNLKPGDIAGCVSKTQGRYGDRLVVCFNYRMMLVHRLIWAYQTGEWPTKQIDHVNRNPMDNRWSNLREATQSENNWNTNTRASNTSGHRGVSWHKKAKKWMVQINANGRHYYLGLFDTKEKAVEAHRKASEELHGSFSHYAGHQNLPS